MSRWNTWSGPIAAMMISMAASACVTGRPDLEAESGARVGALPASGSYTAMVEGSAGALSDMRWRLEQPTGDQSEIRCARTCAQYAEEALARRPTSRQARLLASECYRALGRSGLAVCHLAKLEEVKAIYQGFGAVPADEVASAARITGSIALARRAEDPVLSDSECTGLLAEQQAVSPEAYSAAWRRTTADLAEQLQAAVRRREEAEARNREVQAGIERQQQVERERRQREEAEDAGRRRQEVRAQQKAAERNQSEDAEREFAAASERENQDALAAKLMARHGAVDATKYGTLKALMRNPFAFNGKRVFIRAFYAKNTGPSRAILSTLPGGRGDLLSLETKRNLAREGLVVQVACVATVLGTTEIVVGGIPSQIPNVKEVECLR